MKTVTFEGVTLTIGRANAVMSTRRSILGFRGFNESREMPEELAVLKAVTYPDLTSCVSSWSGELELEDGSRLDFNHPLSFENFCLIPDQLLDAWRNAVYEVNPHWNPANEATPEEKEKKIEK